MKVYSSALSKNKLFHYPGCEYINNIKPENLVVLESKEKARQQGMKCCYRCSRMRDIYYKHFTAINRIIAKNGLKMYIDDDSMYIDNMEFSWKISLDDRNYFILYHANSESYHKLKVVNGRIIHNYHEQKYKGKHTIEAMLEYIVEHDNWKRGSFSSYKDAPKSTKKQRKQYNEAKHLSKRKQIRNVCNILDRLKYENENTTK